MERQTMEPAHKARLLAMIRLLDYCASALEDLAMDYCSQARSTLTSAINYLETAQLPSETRGQILMHFKESYNSIAHEPRDVRTAIWHLAKLRPMFANTLSTLVVGSDIYKGDGRFQIA